MELFLVLELISQAVSFLGSNTKRHNKTVHHSLTTNGSLLERDG